MDKIIELINLLEITRAQPQYGYAVAGGNGRIGNLAEHHYLVAMIGWQIADALNKKGSDLDIAKILKFCLVHDIGEMFGGDIGMYYAKANPKAYQLAKQFEKENQQFMSSYFNNEEEVKKLAEEVLDSQSDECHIAKIADYLEVTHYKLFNGQLKKDDIELIVPKLIEKANKMADTAARKTLTEFIEVWKKKMSAYNSFLDASTDALGI